MERVGLGRWTLKDIELILREASRLKDEGLRIAFISEKFIGTPYKGHTLIGGPETPEGLVVNLGGVDCFTYLDYVSAMRLSGSFAAFKENLKKIRYKSGKVSYEGRNHFFTDWAEYNPSVYDATREVGGGKAVEVKKSLNLKEAGTYILPGIAPVERVIAYIPKDAVDEGVVGRLKTGDYAGIYSERAGLDVTHAGIVIVKDKVYLRHASSKEKKVADEELMKYISGKPGLIVLRPVTPASN